MRSTQVIPGDHGVRDSGPRRRWNNVSWGWSLLVVAGVLAWIVVLIADPGGSDTGGDSDVMTISVTDVVTGEPVPSAEIVAAGNLYRTNESGDVTITFPAESSIIQVIHPDYFPVYGEISSDLASAQRVALSPRS